MLKVKRRKSKKELNCLKFKSHKEIFQKKVWPPGIQRRHSGLSVTALQSVEKNTLNPKQVFITHNRLTQHHGMFNREVKSVDIERFVQEATEMEEANKNMGTTAAQLEGTSQQNHLNLCLDLILTPEKKNQEKPPSPDQTPVEMLTEDCTLAPDSPKRKENENLEPSKRPEQYIPETGDAPQIPLPDNRTESSSDKLQEDPVHQVAESINNMRNQFDIFPGLGFVNSTRQAVLQMKREFCASGSNLLVTPRSSELDYPQKDSTTTMKVTEKAMDRLQMMRTPLVCFLSAPSGNPTHTVIKRVSPEGRKQQLNHHPVLSEPEYILFRKHHQHPMNISSFNKDPRLKRQGSVNLTFHRETRYNESHNLSVNADSSKCNMHLAGTHTPTKCNVFITRPKERLHMMQAHPVHAMPVPRGRPTHTIVRRVSPEGRKQPLVYHPGLSESDYIHLPKRHQVICRDAQHPINISTAIKDPRLKKQDSDALTFCRENRHNENHNLSVNADSSQIGWGFTSDGLLYKHNILQENVSYSVSPRMNEQRQPLLDINSVQLNVSGPEARSSPFRDNQSLFFVPQDIFEHNSPNVQMFGLSLHKDNLACCTPCSNSNSYLQSCHNIQTEDFSSIFQSEDPLRLSSKQLLSSPLDSDIAPRWDVQESPYSNIESHQNICHDDPTSRFQSKDCLALRNRKQIPSFPPDIVPLRNADPIKYVPRWRNVPEYSDCNIWRRPSLLQEGGEDNYDNEWHSSSNLSLSTSHQKSQWRQRSMTTPSLSIEQEDSFFKLPFPRSLSKSLDRKSPDSWRYPRMKLY